MKNSIYATKILIKLKLREVIAIGIHCTIIMKNEFITNIVIVKRYLTN